MVLIIVLVLVVCFVVLAVSAASFHLCYRKFKGMFLRSSKNATFVPCKNYDISLI